jgi:hypothetical protein
MGSTIFIKYCISLYHSEMLSLLNKKDNKLMKLSNGNEIAPEVHVLMKLIYGVMLTKYLFTSKEVIFEVVI